MTENPSLGGWGRGSARLGAGETLGMKTGRRAVLFGGMAALLAPLAGLRSGRADAVQPSFFRIGTGSAGGTYFPIRPVIIERRPIRGQLVDYLLAVFFEFLFLMLMLGAMIVQIASLL